MKITQNNSNPVTAGKVYVEMTREELDRLTDVIGMGLQAMVDIKSPPLNPNEFDAVDDFLRLSEELD